MSRSDTIRCVLRSKGAELFVISPNATVYDALAMMADKGVGALLVFDRDRLAGIVSERDYARKVILQGRSSKDTTVAEIMNDHVITVAPSHTVDECMKLMTERRVRHLPVLGENDSVMGLVSLGDLVKYVITSQREEIEALHAYIASGA